MKAINALVRKTSLFTVMISASVLATNDVHAQTYTAIELASGSLNSTAYSITNGVAAGNAASPVYLRSHATLWSNSVQIDLHPTFLEDTVNGTYGASSVLGSTDSIQVGWGYGPTLQNRYVPIVWSGAADTAHILTLPFTNVGGQALATDGSQIVGYGTGLNNDGTTTGSNRAVVWDVTTEQAIDLGDGGNGAQALGVGGGQQVGYIIKDLQNAALWNGSTNSLVVLHPKDAAASVAYGTDGVQQVGYSGYNVRVRAEATKGNKFKRYDYAMVWTGSAASALNIHPYSYTNSYAKATNGSWIVGYATDALSIGTPGFNHAIVWDATYQATDLNAFLSAPFVGSQALSVDGQGNVAGIAFTANGQRHAVVWMLNPAQ